MTKYVIREVEGDDDETALDLALLHDLTFGDPHIRADTSIGHWWLVFEGDDPMPAAFAGVVPSDRIARAGYFKRVGVLPRHRGHGLQLRLTRTIERRCRRNGWSQVISDTTDNVPSANNFIRAGYRLFTPAQPWAFSNSLYWTRDIAEKS